MKIIAEGTSLESIPNPFMLPYDTWELRLYVSEVVSEDKLTDLEEELIKQEVSLTKDVEQEAHIVSFSFKKSSLETIRCAIEVSEVLSEVELLGWQVVNESSGNKWAWVIGATLLLVILFKNTKN